MIAEEALIDHKVIPIEDEQSYPRGVLGISLSGTDSDFLSSRVRPSMNNLWRRRYFVSQIMIAEEALTDHKVILIEDEQSSPRGVLEISVSGTGSDYLSSCGSSFNEQPPVTEGDQSLQLTATEMRTTAKEQRLCSGEIWFII
ncbi:hypothetical protein L1987_13811 [Smallanthus sonchifolius]|uniref:Uncharacterized protein n=1 Tax=Smallanthus sonchifolius TaxID=185202 RepID=A0ACB9JL17_9ASTR|nr:hypothetical protein L1987_13811 [Smallanthus sonchifolius]